MHEKRAARLSAWRGIGAGYTTFASEATIAKLALTTKADTVEHRLALFNNDKAKNVLKAVAEMSD